MNGEIYSVEKVGNGKAKPLCSADERFVEDPGSIIGKKEHQLISTVGAITE